MQRNSKYSVMTETKKAFKDWDVSDFKHFTDMGGMQKFEESRSHRPFFDERSDKVDYRTPSEGGVEL